MAESPLLRYAVESFVHGIEHSLINLDRDRRFAILHFDQAIELLLKEKIRQCGKKIFRKDGKTLDFHECLSSLQHENVNLPEWSNLELLHEERNAIQHKGLTPDEASFEFYVNNVAYPFARRFLEDELDVMFEEKVPLSLREQFETIEADKMDRTQELLLSAINTASAYPLSAIMSASLALENCMRMLSIKPGGSGVFSMQHLLERMGEDITPEKQDEILKLWEFRNGIIHSERKVDATTAQKYVQRISEIIDSLTRESALVSILQSWDRISQHIKEQKISTYALLLEAKPTKVENGTVTLTFDSSANFHANEIGKSPNLKLVKEAIREITGKDFRIEIAIEE